MTRSSPCIFLFIPPVMELLSLGQKTVKFAPFCMEFHEFHSIPAFTSPLVTNSFYCVEICDFWLKIDPKGTINTNLYFTINEKIQG